MGKMTPLYGLCLSTELDRPLVADWLIYVPHQPLAVIFYAYYTTEMKSLSNPAIL